MKADLEKGRGLPLEKEREIQIPPREKTHCKDRLKKLRGIGTKKKVVSKL